MIYEDEPDKYKKGALLAQGKGTYDMMDISYRKGYTTENTILEVKNPNDLNSSWKIYDRVRK